MLLFVTDACLIGSYSCTFHSAHDVITVFKGVINIYHQGGSASFPVVLGDFGCDDTNDDTCQACRTWFQASSSNSDSANWPGYEAAGVLEDLGPNKVK